MIPLPEILSEVVMALGGALLIANVWALVQPRLRPDKPLPRPVNRGRAITNAIIGALVFVWGFASFVTKR